MMHEPLVGSQKRKARKTKITHLVRTADGRVSPAGGVLGKKLNVFNYAKYRLLWMGLGCSKLLRKASN